MSGRSPAATDFEGHPVLTFLQPRLRFQAAIEGAAIGLTLGLIDAHSTNDDWFHPALNYLIAGFVLGLRHAAGQAWQAWVPLGSSLYLIHRVAIAYGYRPPYVEADAEKATACLLAAWPAGLGLALGALVQVGISGLWHSRVSPSGQGTPRGRPGMEEPDTSGRADSGGAPTCHPVAASTERIPHQRPTVWRLMVVVSWIGIHLAFLRLLLLSDPFFGFGTVYSARFSEDRFNTLRVGMTGG